MCAVTTGCRSDSFLLECLFAASLNESARVRSLLLVLLPEICSLDFRCFRVERLASALPAAVCTLVRTLLFFKVTLSPFLASLWSKVETGVERVDAFEEGLSFTLCTAGGVGFRAAVSLQRAGERSTFSLVVWDSSVSLPMWELLLRGASRRSATLLLLDNLLL